MMTTEFLDPLKHLGWKGFFQQQLTDNVTKSRIARTITEHRDHYILINGLGEKKIGQIPGNWKKRVNEQDYLSVGDWVIIEEKPSHTVGRNQSYLIEKRLSPFSQITRRAAGTQNKVQVLVSNIDIAFIVSSCNQELDINRIERYLALLDDNVIKPFLILNKCDLETFAQCKDQLISRFPQLPLLLTRSDRPDSILPIQHLLTLGMTSVFLGSSGVGKSTLTNLLLRESKQLVESIRHDDSKGRHTTTTRSLFCLPPPYGIIIDTPGLREVQLSENSHLDGAFSDIAEFSLRCRFPDCKHQTEPDCAVKSAIERGEISKEKLLHYQKLYLESKKNQYPPASQRKKKKDS
jgi:ribosome biogenesis GTPase